MSVVLCLPAHLCVSPQRPVAGPPRERVSGVVFLCRGACWRAVLRVCPAWPVCGARSLPGRAAAQARGHTLSLAGLFGSMAGPVGARLWPGARQWGVCRLGGGGFGPLLSFSPPCPSVPLRRPALPAHPLRTRWVGLGRSVGLGGLTWCFFPAGRRGLGSFWGRVARVVCRAAWLLFTGVHAPCVALCVRCPGPPGSCSPVCTPCVWCRVYGVLGLPAPVHRCARPACGVACTASWASRLLFTGVHVLCVVLRVRCPGPPGSCSPVCTLRVWCCVYGVLGPPAPVHRCARPACGVACTASWASRLLFTGVHALRVVSRVRCPGPPRLLFTGVHALCVVLRVRCPGPPGYCSPVCTLRVWCCVYGVLGPPAPVHRCARPACGVACRVP